MSARALDPAKKAFIESAISHGVLLFGDFTLKSGRKSPYFFNAGLLYTSSLLATTASAFSSILTGGRIPEFDVLFGPAYKGISLAAITAVELYKDSGREVGYAYNRKEAKDVSYFGTHEFEAQHGEGGLMVGAPLKGKIVIIDDVLTSGKAIREAITILKSHPEAELVGVAQLLDRQERGQQGERSTVMEVEHEFGVPVEAILRMEDIMDYMRVNGMEEELKRMVKYREDYGVKALPV